ncbi:MAG: phage protein Gp36 family protein [Gemmatimonadaceae bacterium]
MQYASAQDMKDRYPEKDLRELTDVDGQVINDDRLDGALADASAEIDGYLMGRYALPLASVPQALVLYCCDIAMYRLQALRPANDIEDAKNRYDSAIRFLKCVSKGEVQLGVSSSDAPAVQTEGPIVVTAERTFSRDSMRGM